MKILADATLPGLDEAFPKPFLLTRYHNTAELKRGLPEHNVLFCRSTLKVNSELLQDCRLDYVASASSGIDHLDKHYLNQINTLILAAQGSNAVSVADYVMACLAFLDKHLGIAGQQAGIIGVGHVGTQVQGRLQAAGFTVQTYDPLKAMHDPQFQSCTLESLFACDLLCIHAELHSTEPFPSKDLLDEAFLKQVKPGCIIINAARGGIVNEQALLEFGKHLHYCTDVYLNEPAINKQVVDRAILCTPHIAGHSLEAKYLAVAMVSEQLHKLAGLSPPQCAVPLTPPLRAVTATDTWQDLTLSLYNPLHETLALKQATDLESVFLTQRKNHQFRHDFYRYFDTVIVPG